MDEAGVLRDIAVAFEYSYQHDDWITPLEEALEGLTWQHAVTRPRSDSTCIWEIVLHLALWNEDIVRRVETGRRVESPEGSWPALPEELDESAWEAAKSRLRKSLKGVESMLKTTSLAQIAASPYGLPDLLCRITHNGYHIGQITKIREIHLGMV